MNPRSPLSVIRHFCLSCTGGGIKDIRECTGNKPFGSRHVPCILYPYRMGHRPKRWDTALFGKRYSARRAIQLECKRCQNTRDRDVILDCTSQDCPLWKWRLGTPPEYKKHVDKERLREHARSIRRKK